MTFKKWADYNNFCLHDTGRVPFSRGSAKPTALASDC